MNKSQLEHMIAICDEMEKTDALNLLSFILSQKEPGPLMMNIANGHVTSHNLIDQNKIFAESILAFWKLMQAKQFTNQDDDELLSSLEIEKKLRAAQQDLLTDPALQATKTALPKSKYQEITIIANPQTLDAIKKEYETKFKNEPFFKPDHSTPGQSTLAFPKEESAMLFFAEIAQTDPTKSFSVHNKGKLVAKANGGKLWAVNPDGTIGKEYYPGKFVPPINTQASSPAGSPKPLERKNQKKNNRPQNTANFSNQANASAGSPKPLEPKIKKIKTSNRRRPTEHSTFVNKSNPISFGQSSPNNNFQDLIHNELAALQAKLRENNIRLLQIEQDIQAILDKLNEPFTPHQKPDVNRQLGSLTKKVNALIERDYSDEQQNSFSYVSELEETDEDTLDKRWEQSQKKSDDDSTNDTQAHKNVIAELKALLQTRAEQALKGAPPQPNDTNQEPKQNKATTSHADALNKTRDTEHSDNKNTHAPKTTSIQAYEQMLAEVKAKLKDTSERDVKNTYAPKAANIQSYEHMLAEAKTNLKKRPETDLKNALSQPIDTNQEPAQTDDAAKEGWVKSRVATLNNLKSNILALRLAGENLHSINAQSISQPEVSPISFAPPKQQDVDSPLQQSTATNSRPPIERDLRAQTPQPNVNTSEPSGPSVAERIQNGGFFNGVADILRDKQADAKLSKTEDVRPPPPPIKPPPPPPIQPNTDNQETYPRSLVLDSAALISGKKNLKTPIINSTTVDAKTIDISEKTAQQADNLLKQKSSFLEQLRNRTSQLKKTPSNLNDGTSMEPSKQRPSSMEALFAKSPLANIINPTSASKVESNSNSFSVDNEESIDSLQTKKSHASKAFTPPATSDQEPSTSKSIKIHVQDFPFDKLQGIADKHCYLLSIVPPSNSDDLPAVNLYFINAQGQRFEMQIKTPNELRQWADIHKEKLIVLDNEEFNTVKKIAGITESSPKKSVDMKTSIKNLRRCLESSSVDESLSNDEKYQQTP